MEKWSPDLSQIIATRVTPAAVTRQEPKVPNQLQGQLKDLEFVESFIGAPNLPAATAVAVQFGVP